MADLNTAFPGARLARAGQSAGVIATLAAAWALLSPAVQDAENTFIAQLSDLQVLSITSFPVSGGGIPSPAPPSGQLVQVFETGGGSAIETVAIVPSSGAAQTIQDILTATVSLITLTANCTFTFPAFPVAGQAKSFAVALVQDGTGSRTATWPATVKWPGGVAPALTTTPGKTDLFTFASLDGVSWLGAIAGGGY